MSFMDVDDEGIATDKYDVFISYRVRESLSETRALRDALSTVGIRAYVCEEQLEVGQDWATEIFGALESCKVFVVMGSPTYGAKGMEIMATWEELSYALRYNKFMYIVKLFDGPYEQVRTRGLLDNKQFKMWPPGLETPPEGVVDEVAKRVRAIQVGNSASPRLNEKQSAVHSLSSPSKSAQRQSMSPGSGSMASNSAIGGSPAESIGSPVRPKRTVAEAGDSCGSAACRDSIASPVSMFSLDDGRTLERCFMAWIEHSKEEASAQRFQTSMLSVLGCVTAVACVVAWRVCGGK